MSVLTQEMITNLKAELINDPAGRNYAGADAAGKANLFNTPFTKNVTVVETRPARISQVLTQPFAPNAITGADVELALAS